MFFIILRYEAILNNVYKQMVLSECRALFRRGLVSLDMLNQIPNPDNMVLKAATVLGKAPSGSVLAANQSAAFIAAASE